MEREPGTGPKSVHSAISVPLRPQCAVAMDSPNDTPFWPVRSDFPARLLNRHLSELFCYSEYLQLRFVLSSPTEDPDAYQDLDRLLLLIKQQMIPRRDHARCERMLEIYRNLSSRITKYSARIHQPGRERNRAVEHALSNDCEFARRLANVMYLAAAHNPDDSAYSHAWRKALIWHVNDLEYLVTAASANHPLKLPYYHRDPQATGFFDFVSKSTQAETLETLREYGFVPIKTTTTMVVAFSEVFMQVALVDEKGGLRYIDVIDLLKKYPKFPDRDLEASVDTNDPPSVSFTSQSVVRFKFSYDWDCLCYV